MTSTDFSVDRVYQKLWRSCMEARSRVWPAPSRRILFTPRPEWEGAIQDGFRVTRHEIAFDSLSQVRPGEYEIMVPLTIDGAHELTGRPDLLGQSLLPMPCRDVFDLCNDKLLLSERLNALGCGVHIPRLGLESGSPFVTKDRVDENGRSCRIGLIPTGKQPTAVDWIDERELRQEYVVGAVERASHRFFRDGRIGWSLEMEYRFDNDRPLKGQDEPSLQRFSRPRYPRLWTEILRAINYEGLCCIDYKESLRGLQLLEINPRCGGSLARYFFLMADHLSRRG